MTLMRIVSGNLLLVPLCIWKPKMSCFNVEFSDPYQVLSTNGDGVVVVVVVNLYRTRERERKVRPSVVRRSTVSIVVVTSLE